MRKFLASEYRRINEQMGQSHRSDVVQQRCFGDALALCVAVVTATVMIALLA